MRLHLKKTYTTLSMQGFTLIELMVALSIFAIVMVVSTGTLLSMIDANARAQALYSAGTNLSFALDNITREIRTGYHYNCFTPTGAGNPNLPDKNDTVDCTPTGRSGIAFLREKDDKHIGYRLNGGKLQQKIDEPGARWIDLTADEVVVTEFNLVVSNTTPYEGSGDTEQPTVDLTLKGRVNNGVDTDIDFDIQTHIVQRRLDILN